MKIRWLAHASFLIQGDGLRIITDPYTPSELDYQSINEPADLVIRSSADDKGHNNAEMIPGQPTVVTATEIDPKGATIRGLRITTIPVQESLIYKDSPIDNAMYRFTLENIRISHMGDAGNRLTDEQLEALQGTDVLLALTGGPPTIDLSDLEDAIKAIKPRVVIPMHYMLPTAKPHMLSINEFTDRFPAQRVTWNDGAEIELTQAKLPTETQVIVLKASTA